MAKCSTKSEKVLSKAQNKKYVNTEKIKKSLDSQNSKEIKFQQRVQQAQKESGKSPCKKQGKY